VDVAIPANDDSIRAVEIILNELADAVAIGKTMVSARQQESEPRPRRARPSRRPTLARADGSEGPAVATLEEQTAVAAEPAATPEPAEAAEPAPTPKPEETAAPAESDQPSSGT